MQSRDRREELLERAYRRGYALRRRRQWAATLASLAMVVVVGTAAFEVSRPSQRHTLSVVPTTTTTPSGCATVPAVTPGGEAPNAIGLLTDFEPVVGADHLWTTRSALDVQPVHDSDVWRLKFPWFTWQPFGIPTIEGRRIDGPGTFHAEANRATTPNNKTFVASTLEFSAPGCWEITARYVNDVSTLTFRLQVGASETALEHALRELGVVVSAAPADAVGLGDAKFCGVEGNPLSQERTYNETARTCFLDEFNARRPAVFIVQQPTVEGDPIVTIYRSQTDGSVDLFFDATRDKFGSGKWESSRCGTLQTEFPSAPVPLPSYYFDVTGCAASTPASG